MEGTISSQSKGLLELSRELKRKVFDLNSIYDLSSQLRREEDTERLVNIFLLSLMGKLGCVSASLLLPDKLGVLRVKYSKGVDRERASQVRIEYSSPLWEELEKEGWLFVESASGRVKKDVQEIVKGTGARFLFFIPFREGQRACLTLGEKVAHSGFREEDLQIASILSFQMAAALESLLLFGELKEMYTSAVMALIAAVEARDPYSKGHAERTSRWAMKIGREFGLRGEELERFGFNVLLHDIGKIGLKENIIWNRPGNPLTPLQWEEVRLHPQVGAKILREAKFLDEAVELALHHHERWDGKGYPDGLKGVEIPLKVRILSVADSYDAMIIDRPYRKALSLEEAIQELEKGRGSQFDPQVVNVFLEILRRDQLPQVVADLTEPDLQVRKTNLGGGGGRLTLFREDGHQ